MIGIVTTLYAIDAPQKARDRRNFVRAGTEEWLRAPAALGSFTAEAKGSLSSRYD